MSKGLLALALSAATLAGCATTGQNNQSANETGANPTAAPQATKTLPSVSWGNKTCEGKVSQTKGAVSSFVNANPNNECVSLTISDRAKKSAPVTYTGLVSLESCSPTTSGVASNAYDVAKKAASGVVGLLGGFAGKAAADAVPSGAVGNVVRTQTTRAAVGAKTDAKAGTIDGISSASTLTKEQQVACTADVKVFAGAVQADVEKFKKDYKALNPNATPVVTYSKELTAAMTYSPK